MSRMTAMDDLLSASVAAERGRMILVGVLALLALFLSAVGLSGILAFAVAQRTQEIGIRVALGASPRDVIALVATQGLRLVCIGTVLGLLGGWVLTRFLDGLLYGVSPTDTLTFLLSALVLTGTAAVAAAVPARRAIRLDPTRAIGGEGSA